MALGVFDLFTVGIGPSSSHTVGPMRAAAAFISGLGERVTEVAEVRVDLYGSLAATGRGHGTLSAIMLGLEGNQPDEVLPGEIEDTLSRIASEGTLRLGGEKMVFFQEKNIMLRPLTVLDRHSNGMRLEVRDSAGEIIDSAVYFSIGGGFIIREDESEASTETLTPVPLPFDTAAKLLAHCEEQGLNFSGVMRRNELVSRDDREIREGILHLRDVMDACVANSVAREGVLPGGLNVRRRAPEWQRRLQSETGEHDASNWQRWVNFIALAVNEENASGGRVVTAPTNGAAGILPAVLYYACHFVPEIAEASREMKDDAVVRFFLTAAAVGILYKTQASISGAEVGCQGEVGSASSMAAAGLAELLGGTPRQVENAAEIAMEHNLGLTCDPIGGLVQIPCIERNAIAAAKAINAAQMAMWGDGVHRVSLDEVIITMRETGRDMSSKYKETAMGGLAVNVVEC